MPPEEKLTLLALIAAAETGEVLRSRPDLDRLPALAEEAARLTGIGIQGTEIIGKRLFIRGLVDDQGVPKLG